MNKGLKVRRGAGSFNKSVMFVTAPSGSTVTMQNMVRSDNLATDVQYQEASAKDQSCVTIKQCGEVSKGDRVRVSLEVTTSKDAMGYWASESGLITDKREVNLKSGKQTVTLDITASGNLSLDTKFFCKGDDGDATITAANLHLYKYTAGTTIKTATEKNGVWRFNGLDLGLWLIKAEKESETPATQEFEIIEFGVYRISMAFEIVLYLYNNGDENNAVTGGWEAKAIGASAGGTAAAPEIDREPSKLVIMQYPSLKAGICCTRNKVDLTDYTTIEITSDAVYVAEDSMCSLCIWTSIGSNIEANCISKTELTNTSLSKTVDISKISGKCVVGIAVGSGSSNGCKIGLKTCVLRG